MKQGRHVFEDLKILITFYSKDFSKRKIFLLTLKNYMYKQINSKTSTSGASRLIRDTGDTWRQPRVKVLGIAIKTILEIREGCVTK